MSSDWEIISSAIKDANRLKGSPDTFAKFVTKETEQELFVLTEEQLKIILKLKQCVNHALSEVKDD